MFTAARAPELNYDLCNPPLSTVDGALGILFVLYCIALHCSAFHRIALYCNCIVLVGYIQ